MSAAAVTQESDLFAIIAVTGYPDPFFGLFVFDDSWGRLDLGRRDAIRIAAARSTMVLSLIHI